MSKKVGSYTVNKIHENNKENETVDKTKVVTKPVWADMYRIDDKENPLWGWTYFYMHPDTWNKVYMFRDEFNSKKEVNMKVKEKKDYYGDKKKQIYIPRPIDKMPKVLNQLPFTWRQNFGNYEVVIERKEDVDWQTVQNNATAKAL